MVSSWNVLFSEYKEEVLLKNLIALRSIISVIEVRLINIYNSKVYSTSISYISIM